MVPGCRESKAGSDEIDEQNQLVVVDDFTASKLLHCILDGVLYFVLNIVYFKTSSII